MNKEDIEIYEEEISVDVKSDVLKGDPGADGANGKDGQNGKNGIDGKSAYKIWLEQGNEGTEEDFIASLKGEQGEKPVFGTDYFTEADKQEIIKELTQDIEEAKSNFNSNAVEKTNTFNSNATSKLEEYNLNAENKLNEFNENASSYEERIETLESENVELKAKDIELETENERLKEDLNNIAITGQSSGENITIEDSAEARFKELKISGNSWQETRDVTDEEGSVIGAMPSPEYPSEIRNCGDNVNEFDGELEIGSIDANTGQNTANANCVRTKNYQKVNHSENYVLSNDKNYGYVYYLYDKNYNFIKALNQSNVLSLTKDTQYIKFRSIQSNSENDLNVKYKLERGTKATPYTPYGTGSINAKIQNENIFDGELEFGNIDNTGNNNGTSENYIRTVNYINVTNFDNIAITIQSTNKWTQEYYITYDKDKKIIQRTRMRSTVEEVNEFSKTIDVKNASYVRFFIYNATAFTTLGDNKWILTEGTEIKPYTPHQEQNFTFPLLEGQRLMKGDYLADDGIHHKRGKVVIDGSQTPSDIVVNSTTGNTTFIFPNSIAPNTKKNRDLVLYCNQLQGVTWINYRNYNNQIIQWNDTSASFCMGMSTDCVGETVKTIQEWFTANPMVIEYELAEENIEPYTEEQEKVYNEINKTAHSYKGTTHIFCTDEISCNFEATYIKDLETYIRNLIASEVANES